MGHWIIQGGVIECRIGIREDLRWWRQIHRGRKNSLFPGSIVPEHVIQLLPYWLKLFSPLSFEAIILTYFLFSLRDIAFKLDLSRFGIIWTNFSTFIQESLMIKKVHLRALQVPNIRLLLSDLIDILQLLIHKRLKSVIIDHAFCRYLFLFLSGNFFVENHFFFIIQSFGNLG